MDFLRSTDLILALELVMKILSLFPHSNKKKTAGVAGI